MRILGIDPGSRATGYGLIEKQGNRLRHLDNGVILTGGEAPLSERLGIIYRDLGGVIDRYAPTVMAVEQIFLARNALSALKLGHARGVALLAGIHHELPVFEYTALQVKSAVVGYGRADKAQIQAMVRVLLALPEIAQEDASDALAVAICHAHSAGMNQRLAQAGKR
ncbi:crossover junction endodeoxyribonuclease RuvC [Geoalkalibacter halelectricus]|uniref:Crossover junction endodeoxyribonuclease RuvC n=1 Tax=Geoalkalibacter halelectricus TaxID=2847045 RepID=A0ABY5ZP93_9BACT|nr:crossover junction endodeoxyribonuclease RuvC [Geoalkalibacter halelectricus]MDO3379212.1 crossover junction endodeoxyribonuclease RuvC [Geoalkalibacter halelectricus]UWZ80970.1 crossover junction endodeoxyribonuclease RuvC [Geoalkalibacter halelectricus]